MLADPVTYLLGGVGGAVAKEVGLKLLQSGMKPILAKALASGAGGATFGAAYDAIRSPEQQQIERGDYDPLKHAVDTIKGGAVMGLAGLAGPLGEAAGGGLLGKTTARIGSEAATFGIAGPLIQEGRLPTADDLASSLGVIAGLAAVYRLPAAVGLLKMARGEQPSPEESSAVERVGPLARVSALLDAAAQQGQRLVVEESGEAPIFGKPGRAEPEQIGVGQAGLEGFAVPPSQAELFEGVPGGQSVLTPHEEARRAAAAEKARIAGEDAQLAAEREGQARLAEPTAEPRSGAPVSLEDLARRVQAEAPGRYSDEEAMFEAARAVIGTDNPEVLAHERRAIEGGMPDDTPYSYDENGREVTWKVARQAFDVLDAATRDEQARQEALLDRERERDIAHHPAVVWLNKHRIGAIRRTPDGPQLNLKYLSRFHGADSVAADLGYVEPGAVDPIGDRSIARTILPSGSPEAAFEADLLNYVATHWKNGGASVPRGDRRPPVPSSPQGISQGRAGPVAVQQGGAPPVNAPSVPIEPIRTQPPLGRETTREEKAAMAAAASIGAARAPSGPGLEGIPQAPVPPELQGRLAPRVEYPTPPETAQPSTHLHVGGPEEALLPQVRAAEAAAAGRVAGPPSLYSKDTSKGWHPGAFEDVDDTMLQLVREKGAGPGSPSVAQAKGQAGPDALQKLQALVQAGPAAVRWLGALAEPAGAAIAQRARGNRIPLAMVRHDLFVATNAAAARAWVLKWQGMYGKLFGLDGNAIARNVELVPGKNVPPKARGRLDDIFVHPGDYRTKGQDAAGKPYTGLSQDMKDGLTEIEHTFRAMLQAQTAANVTVDEVRSYFARIVRKSPQGVEPTTTTKGHALARSFTDIRTGIKKGYEYYDPITAMQMRLVHGVETIANARLAGEIKALGETGAERLRRESANLIQQANEARDNYRRVRDRQRSGQPTAGSPDGGKTEVEYAADLFRRATQALRVARIRARQPHLGEGTMYGRIFPQEVIDEVAKYRGNDEGGFADLAQAWRGLMVMGDLSQLFVQGGTLPFRRPDIWWRAAGYSVGAILRSPYEYVTQNWAYVQDGIKAGAIMPPTDFLLARGGPVSRRIAQLPIVKETQRAFEWFVFIAQTEMWKAARGIDLVGADRSEMASSLRKSLGVVLRPGLTQSQRNASSLLFFAPQFSIAMSTMMLDALRGGARGDQARRTVGALMMGGLAATIAGQYAINQKLPNLTDPNEKDWLAVSTPSGTISLFGPIAPYLRALAQVSYNSWHQDAAKAGRAALVLAMGRLGLVPSTTLDFITGKDMAGEPVEQSLTGLFGALPIPAPISATQIGEHLWKVSQGEEALHVPTILGQPVGLRTAQFTPAQRRNRLQDAAAEKAYGQPWKELLPSQQAAITTPEMRAIREVAASRRLRIATGPEGDLLRREAKANELRDTNLNALAKKYASTPSEYRQARQEVMTTRRQEMAQIESDRDRLGLPRPEEIRPGMARIQAIYDLSEKDFADPHEYWLARRVLESGLSDSERRDMQALVFESLQRPGLSPMARSLETQYWLDQRTLDPYWNAGEELNPEVQHAWDMLSEAQKKQFQGKPPYGEFFEARARYRLFLARRDPEVFEALKRQYPERVPAKLARAS